MDDLASRHRFEEIADRLARIEDQLAILSERAGVPYERPEPDRVPPSVRALAAIGKRNEAVTELRRLRECSLGEAVAIVDAL